MTTPETFEEWLAKQHGDPEEIGFLQALRIAYYAGQDSCTKKARGITLDHASIEGMDDTAEYPAILKKQAS